MISGLEFLNDDLKSMPGFRPAIRRLGSRLQRSQKHGLSGRVVEAVGTVVKVALVGVTIGDLVEFRSELGETLCFGEVVGFAGDLALVTLLGENRGISVDCQVVKAAKTPGVPCSDHMLGRVFDGLGRLADGGPPLPEVESYYPVYADPPAPLTRKVIEEPLPMRVRCLDSLLTIGEGQRLGIFAAAGGGKSTLMSMLVKGSECDVRVIALIGERGREVREFIEHALGPEAMASTVVVVSTSDRSSLERARAAYVATSIAEFFRDKGKRVLLMMDSVTRFARALREIGLAAGEPPARQGFPPSVFATLPRLLERAGMSSTGSITGLYTVLVEGDDFTEPVADEVRSILDGHIVLSRELASANHYPAVDILASASRTMNLVVNDEHLKAAGKIRRMMADYRRSELLIRVGEYQRGSDPNLDEAIEKWPRIEGFLQQGLSEFTSYEECLNELKAIAGV